MTANTNTFMDNLKNDNNFGFTENSAVKHVTTKSAVLDMFALGGAYRNRTDDDCITLFKSALHENADLAMKCLFYLRDCRGGQGERRFFRVCMNWLADAHPNIALINLQDIPEYGRYDDLIYSFMGTELEGAMLLHIKTLLALDLECNTPSLLAKWLPSENASSDKTKAMANKIRKYLKMSHKEYRKTLSYLRKKINVLERLMSANKWDEIEFDKIPSKAGLIYKNAFARRDIISKKYEEFAKNKNTKVNAEILNPVDIAEKIFRDMNLYNDNCFSETDRAMYQKYWDNLKDYYNGRKENGLAIVDTSGSMWGRPLAAAVSMGAYIAERGHGPFANHFITFSETPKLVEFKGVDIVDKFYRAERADWGMNTNLKAVFNMLLRVAKEKSTKPEDIPERLYIFSDMEFDGCLGLNDYITWNSSNRKKTVEGRVKTLLEEIAEEWKEEGYELPKVIFWNLDARHDNIPALGERFSYVSGNSMNMIECILSGKDGYDLMLEKLNSNKYEKIRAHE